MLTHTQLVKICSAFIEPQSIVSSERLLNGLSNHNFLIRTEQQAYLLKCYKDHWPDVGLEAQRYLSENQVCSAPIWLDKASKVAAFIYIEGNTAQSTLSFDLIGKLVKVHSYSVKTQPMNIAHELFFYEQSAVYKQYQQQIKLALKTVTSIPINEGFCHNDLVKENIIENVSGSYLIDFEYAKTNDVYFDLAALIVAFKLNEHDQQTLLAQYENCSLAGSDFTSSTIKLNCYRLFFLVLCVGWYEQRDINNKTIELRAQLDELTNLNFG